MAEARQHTDAYPDPTNHVSGRHPYPALDSNSINGDGGNTEASKQYLLLANQLPDHITGDVPPSEDEAEGVPMANQYLNLHPQLDFDDLTVDESEIEAATDVESRGGASQRGRGKARRGWKWALKGTAHDPKFNRNADDRPRGRGGKRGRGRRKALDPGRDFKTKQAKATQAYVEGRLDEALEAAREAVHANPEIFAAHSLLGEILLAQGQKQDSLAALLSGAVTARDANTWIMVADRTLDYADEQRNEDVLQQAVFCYTQAIDLEKRGEFNFEARIAKMQLWIELGEYTKARRDCKQLVGLKPTDIDLVRQMAELCAMTGDSYEISIARKSYELVLENAYPIDKAMDEATLSAAWGHLNIYLELVDRTALPGESIFILKQNARKFLGRGHETFWDQYHIDDREFDLEHTRRLEIREFHDDVTSSPAYGEALPLELRIKLGLFRLKMGVQFHSEAMYHFEQLMPYRDEVESLFDMFYIVATNLSAVGDHQSALSFYEPIKELQDVLTDDFWMQYGNSLKTLARFEDAADCFLKATELNPFNVNAKIDLAHLYQNELKDNDRAYKIVDEIIALNKRDLVRREKLHMRPKTRGKGRKRQRDGEVSSEDEDGLDVEEMTPDAEDTPITAKRSRQKAKDIAPSRLGSSSLRPDPDFDPDEEDQPDDPTAKERQNQEKRLWRTSKKTNEARPKTTKTNERKMELLESLSGKVNENFRTVERLWDDFLVTDDETVISEWMEAALTLYEIFRSVKHFYPTRDKHKQFRGFLRLEPGEAKFMNEMESWKKQLEAGEQADGKTAEPADKDFAEFYSAPKAIDETTPKDFYDIPFATWHHVFVDLALLYARRSRQAACYQIIDDGLYSANVFFHDPDILNTTQATSLCCGFIFNDSERLCFAARWFLNRYDLRAGAAFQLFSGVNRLSYGSSLWFSAGPTQKHMLRSIKALDYHVFTPEVREKFDWSLQLPTLRKRVEKYGQDAGHLDANALLTYGHMVGVANHSQSALPYFFRAFALQPENITVNLSIATMYIQNAMKRQTDNRQYGIAQGLSFLYRYYNIRSSSQKAIDRQEAEYNVGRTWHMLGLTHLAIKSYERALALDEAVQSENVQKSMQGQHNVEDFSKEAAFALVNIFAIAGNDETARKLTEKWLVL